MKGPPSKEEEADLQGGGGVFTPLATESKITAEEVSDPTFNMKDSADSESLTVRLSPFPAVSCRTTLNGEIILSFHWEANN